MATFLDRFPDPVRDIDPSTVSGEQTAVFAGGCFWCVEAVFEPLEGVIDAVSGYAGGTKETADYETVCSGTTNHAEAVRVRYDPNRVTYGQLLKLFFSIAHDPTQLNRQGNDVGRQYRSTIFYADEQQKEVAEAYIKQLNEAHVFDAPIVTTLEPLEAFYEGEGYHQDYAERNPWQPYIAYTAAPKVKKLHEFYSDRLKDAKK
ncbi:MAG TPA: peptide-methionine (S)-S-oxide reductase MsrA [Chloroflexota bacterium]|jgi:peptide-methionine (S)-S-oxide reductase